MLFEKKIKELMSKRNIDFDLAFELLYKHDFLEELETCNFSFEEWDCVCRKSSDFLKELALEKMVSLAEKEEDWFIIYDRSESVEKIRKLSLEKIDTYIKTFKECVQIYAICDGPLKELALKKFVSFGETRDNLLFLHNVGLHKEFKEAVIEKLSGIAETFNDWFEIYKRSSVESDSRKIAIEKMKTMV